MEKERKITAPEGCEIEKVEIVDGVAVVTFKEKERELPKSWEEFCKENPRRINEFYVSSDSKIESFIFGDRDRFDDRNLLPDRATAEAVLALCQLIQLRDCYNGDWAPDWNNDETKYTIEFSHNGNIRSRWNVIAQCSILFFKTEELRDEFLRNFRPLIEKIKPLYGIKEGVGE